uniref:Uncharacterized protein n=1 Tax=Octopus bimaculoides TaxID=37653 RepID=A0A0L8I348_OCTBM
MCVCVRRLSPVFMLCKKLLLLLLISPLDFIYFFKITKLNDLRHISVFLFTKIFIRNSVTSAQHLTIIIFSIELSRMLIEFIKEIIKVKGKVSIYSI